MSTDERIIEVPEGIEAKIELDRIIIKGPKGEVSRTYPTKNLKIELKDKKIYVAPLQKGARVRALVGTFEAHIKNMLKGVVEPYVYKLKVCSTHFPINVKLSGRELQITNFLGEKKPRKVTLPPDVSVKIEGDVIVVEAVDKELAGRTASDIEQATRINSKDRRIFQDGIFMIEKAGKPIA